MQHVFRAAMVALFLAVLPVTAHARPSVDDPAGAAEGLSTMSVAQARGYAEASGGTVRQVEDLEDGTYEMTIDYPGEIPVYLLGFDCAAAGEAKRCSEFQLFAYFGFDTEAEARAMEHTLDINWLSDLQVGLQLQVWRYALVAGSTDRHLIVTFQTFVDAVRAAIDIVYTVAPDSEMPAPV
tara:strand:+ start:102 stop:644 length:543 start_codon:yes stop_codon:yes gene_type:complete